MLLFKFYNKKNTNYLKYSSVIFYIGESLSPNILNFLPNKLYLIYIILRSHAVITLKSIEISINIQNFTILPILNINYFTPRHNNNFHYMQVFMHKFEFIQNNINISHYVLLKIISIFLCLPHVLF